jgi:AraC family transcriptional regulator
MADTQDFMTVEAELRVPLATAMLARFHMPAPVDRVLSERDDYWLDLCLTPRMKNARACFEVAGRGHGYGRLGELFVAPPGQGLHTRSDGGEQLSILCLLDPAAIDRWFEGAFRWTGGRLAALLDVDSPAVRMLLLRLAEEARHPGLASGPMAELIAAQLAIELARYCADVADEPAAGGLAPWRLRLIDERLAEPGPAPALADLAALCGVSIRQLTRGFRASRGRSIGGHVAAERAEAARRLLATRASVKSVAATMGFASAPAFSHAFRRQTGESPSDFRQRLGRTGL